MKHMSDMLKREADVFKLAQMKEDDRERERQDILDIRGCSWGMSKLLFPTVQRYNRVRP